MTDPERALLAKALDAIRKRVEACAQGWAWNAYRWDEKLGAQMPWPHDEGCEACRDLRELLVAYAAMGERGKVG